jgi:ribonuclease HI
VVIKCDSAYVVRGATDWMRKWRRTGFCGSRGQRLVNGDLFEELDELVFELNGRGVTVLFWQMPRALNGEADQLANLALDEYASEAGTPHG